MWNDTFELTIESMGDEVEMACLDKDFMNNDIIGELSVTVAKLCSQQLNKMWLPLNYKGKQIGEVLLETKYTPGNKQDSFTPKHQGNDKVSFFSEALNHGANKNYSDEGGADQSPV